MTTSNPDGPTCSCPVRHDNAEPHEGVRESAPRVARSISNQPQPESEPRANKTRASLRSPRRSTPRARRMNLSLTHVNAWSVAKVTFMLSIAGAIIEVLAAALVWLLLDAVGVFDQLNNIVSSTGLAADSLNLSSVFSLSTVLSVVTILAIVGVVLVTLLGHHHRAAVQRDQRAGRRHTYHSGRRLIQSNP